MKNMNAEGMGRYVKPMTIALVSGLAVTVILLLLLAAVLVQGDFSSSFTSVFALVASAGGSFVNGFVAARIIGKRALLVGIVAGAIFCFIIFFIGIVFLNSGIGAAFLTKLATFLAASVLGAVIGVNGRRRR